MLLSTTELGRIARTGATVVLAGAPNAGKSSLFNALLGEQRALVTDIPGTTRDTIDAIIEGEGVPLRLVDTAGLRGGADAVEQMGIEAAMRELDGAHLVLVCGETSDLIDATSRWVEGKSGGIVIRVLTKADVSHETRPRADAVVSAERHTGLAELTVLLGREIASRYGTIGPSTPVLTRARHFAALMVARDELVAFSGAWTGNNLPAIVAAGHVRAALHALDELIGSVEVEDILEAVFSRFCVGK
jgi:tRNA modification GTPase